MTAPHYEPVTEQEARELARALPGEWRVVDGQLQSEFVFPDFATALAFTNRIGDAAEALDHHPDIFLGWGKVRVTISTHAIGGLSRSDFELASKIAAL